MTTGQVHQLSMQLGGSERHDCPRGIGLQLPEGPMEPHGGVLKHVVGVIPTPHVGESVEHPAGEGPQPAGAEFDDPIASLQITFSQLIEAGGEVVGVRVW